MSTTRPGGAYRWHAGETTAPHETWSVNGRSEPQAAPPPPRASAETAPLRTLSSSPRLSGEGGSMTHSVPLSSERYAGGIPDAPSTFPELEAMSLNDLRTLHDERAKFDDFVSKHKHQRVVDETVARLRSDVEQLETEYHAAVDRATEKPEDDAKVEETRLKVEQSQGQVDNLQKKQDEWFEKNGSDRLMERLRIAIRELEAASDSLEKNMLSSSMNFDDFLTRYIECRKKYHERALKLEQLKMEARDNISFGR